MKKINLLALFATILSACTPSPSAPPAAAEVALAEECGLDGVLSYGSLGAEYDVSTDQVPASEAPEGDCLALMRRDAERQALIDTKNEVEVLIEKVAEMRSTTLRFETYSFGCDEMEKVPFELDISGWETYTAFHRYSHGYYSGPWSPTVVKVTKEGVAELECRFDEMFKLTVGFRY